MLIDFTVENYRSIREAQTLSLLATNTGEHPDNFFSLTREKNIRLLKSAVIYGPNASGKTNIIKALQAMIRFITLSTDLKLDQPIPYYEPFKLTPSCASEPTKFEIEFVVSDVRHIYKIAYNQKEIVAEELYYFPKKIRTKLFVRQHGKPIDFGTSLTGPKKSIEEVLLCNVLFLSKAANSNNSTLQEIYRAINGEFLIDFDVCTGNSTIYEKMTSFLMNSDKVASVAINEFMRKIDNSVENIHISKKDASEVNVSFAEPIPEEAKKFILDTLRYEVKFTHKINSTTDQFIQFELKDESAGTIRAFNIAGHIILSLTSGATLVIDELNNSLHPIISKFIIELFNNKKSNPNNAQIIFTTHDTTLLDQSVFRRDQIWFTEKNSSRETRIFSLSEFDYKEVRHNTPFEKWYLSGKFGAIPIVNDFDMLALEGHDAKAEKSTDPQAQTEDTNPL